MAMTKFYFKKTRAVLPFLALLLFLSFKANAQCPTGNITLTTQAQVNQFKIDYPNCTHISGYLLVGVSSGASDITDLSPLENITSVGGAFYIYNNPLTNIDGLNALTSIGGELDIAHNSVLTNINGLSNLTAIGVYLQLWDNPQLQNLNGLINLTAIGGDLIIEDNTVLNDISGLSNVAVTSITPALGFGLYIVNNPALAVCNLPNFCAYLANPANTHPRTISGNLAQCVNEAAVVAACSAPQCPTGNVVLTTQADVDQFKIDYPNCTKINGYLGIGGSVANLNGLSNITTITGSIDAGNATSLVDISGLSNLTSVGQDAQFANTALTNIDGLSSLTSVVGYIYIGSNNALTNINGLSSLTSVGGNLYIESNAGLTNIDGLSSLTSIGGNLYINTNAALTNIDGLSSLTSVGGIYIENNAGLTNIDGLSSLTSIGGDLMIRNNAALTNLNGLSNITTITGSLDVYNASSLTDISGLSNLTSVGQDVQFENTALTNIDGLSNLTTVVGGLNIAHNMQLQHVDGLSNLTTIGVYLQFWDNPKVLNLNGLINLTAIGGDLIIIDNAILNDISGLSNVASTSIIPAAGYGLYIADNPALAVCNLPNFCAYLANPANTHPRTISGNLAQCVNEAAVVAACASVLPVTLTDFTAKINGNYALLQWQTASEQNNKGFEILRSGDDGKFVKIGEVQATQYAVRNTQYAFTDKTPLNGNNYYKLVQIDNDGKENELGVRELNFGLSASGIQLYPNPTSINEVTVNLGNSAVKSVKLIDFSGKTLQVIQPRSTVTSITISLAKYPVGTYLVRIEGNNGVEVRKVVKL